MPSMLHEALIELFRNCPELAPELLRDTLHQRLPRYTKARIESSELNEIQPTEYRADLVVVLADGEAEFGIVVEVQLAPDPRKQYVWPVYVAALRARIECPVCLLVITPDQGCERWAARPIAIGGESYIKPVVLGPSAVPEITDSAVAAAHPELAVLSVMAYGQDDDAEKAARIAHAAQQAIRHLDDARSKLYCDLIFSFLSQSVFQTLRDDMLKYEYQSDFAKKYLAEGREEGREEGRVKGLVEGRAELIARLLTVRFGALNEDVRARISSCSLDELDAIGERLLTAVALEEALSAAQYLHSTPADGTTGSHELTSRS